MEQQRLTFSSRSENIVLVEKLIQDVCSLFKINEDNFGNILVALTEAVNNAIEHGNKADPNKKIEICFNSKESSIIFSIKDQGPGFNFQAIPDPTAPENIEKPSGRGVFLMKNLADRVDFEDNGSKVILEFNISKN